MAGWAERDGELVAPRRSGLALPGSIGGIRPRATQFWHCQGFLAETGSSPLRIGTARNYWRSPLRIGTARNNWRKPVPRHPTLALPVMIGVRGFLATQDWHCQGFLASAAPAPLSSGAANDFRHPLPPRCRHPRRAPKKDCPACRRGACGAQGER